MHGLFVYYPEKERAVISRLKKYTLAKGVSDALFIRRCIEMGLDYCESKGKKVYLDLTPLVRTRRKSKAS